MEERGAMYNELTDLQCAVKLDAPSSVIFETIDALEAAPQGPAARITLSSVMHTLYNDDGNKPYGMTYRKAAQQLDCTSTLVQYKHATALRRARHHLGRNENGQIHRGLSTQTI